MVTPRVRLRYVDDDIAHQLATLAADRVHDASWMPFAIPWTDDEPPELERNLHRYWWRCRAETRPDHWDLAAFLAKLEPLS